MEKLPDELVYKILLIGGPEVTNRYHSITKDVRAKDNRLWYEFSKFYFKLPYEENTNYEEDVNILIFFLHLNPTLKSVLSTLSRCLMPPVIYKYIICKFGLGKKYFRTLTIMYYVKNIETAIIIKNLGYDIYDSEENLESALFQVSTVEVAKWLVENGVDPFKKDITGSTALHFSRNEEVAAYLISLGLNVNHKNNKGLTPLFVADCVGLAKLYCDHGANIFELSNSGRNILHYCLSPSLAEWLINKGLDPNQTDNNGRNTLMNNHNLSVFKILLKHGADLDHHCLTPNGGILDVYLISLQHHRVAKFLIRECLIDQYSLVVTTKTYVSCVTNYALMKSFLSLDRDLNFPSLDVYSPLNILCRRQMHSRYFKLFLENGADPNIGITTVPLMLVQDKESAKLLISYGADVNAVRGINSVRDNPIIQELLAEI